MTILAWFPKKKNAQTMLQKLVMLYTQCTLKQTHKKMSASIVASKSFTIYSVKKVPDMDDGLCQYPAFMSDIYIPPFLSV